MKTTIIIRQVTSMYEIESKSRRYPETPWVTCLQKKVTLASNKRFAKWISKKYDFDVRVKNAQTNEVIYNAR